MSLSPVCLINSGSTPADVTSGASVNGALANTAGVVFFAVKAIGADEITGPAGLATLNASLSINQTNKTFTFTAPGNLGTAVIFMATVGVSPNSSLGSGRDINGAIVPAWTTTFKVNVLASNSLRVIAGNENLEQDTNVGWINPINAAIRTASGGGGGGGTGGQFNLTLSNGVNNDVSTTGLLVGLIGGPTAAFSISGIATTATSKAGLPVVLINTTAFQMTLLHENTGSSATHRIRCLAGNGGNLVLKPFGGSAVLYYDNSVSQRWYAVSRGWEQQSPDGVDVREFGAVGTVYPASPVDDTVAIDLAYATLSAASATFGAPLKLLLPNVGTNGITTYYRNRPLFVHDDGVEISGETVPGAGVLINRTGIDTTANNNVIPAIVVMQNSSPNPTYANETPHGGTGSVWTVLPDVSDGTHLRYELGETDCSILNGAASFTVEFFINPKGLSLGAFVSYPIFISGGVMDNVSFFNVALGVIIEGDGTGNLIQVRVQTTGGQTFAYSGVFGSGPYILANTLSYVKITYDGANIKFFVNGSLTTTTAASAGTLVQQNYESVLLFWQRNLYPDSGATSFAKTFTLGGFRIRLGVADTSTGMVTSAPTADANTLICMDWKPSVANGAGVDSAQPSWLIATAGITHSSGGISRPVGGAVWLLGYSGGQNYITYVTIRGLQINSFGGGIYANAALRMKTIDCQITGAQGITYDNFSYSSRMDGVNSNARNFACSRNWCIAGIGDTQFLGIGNVQANGSGSTTGSVMVCSSSLNLDGAYFIPNGWLGVLLEGVGGIQPVEMHNVAIFDDGTLVTDSLLHINGPTSFSIEGGGGVSCIHSSAPAVVIGSTGSARFNTAVNGLSPSGTSFASIGGSGSTQTVPVLYSGGVYATCNISDGIVPILVPERELFGVQTITFPSDANHSLSTTNFEALSREYLIAAGTITTTRKLTWPGNPGKIYQGRNNNAQTVQITRTGSSTSVAVTPGSTFKVQDNGTDLVSL